MNTCAAETEAGAPERQSLSKRLVLLMAITCGMTVANLYYNQPLLADIGRTFDATATEVGIIPMLTQLGYAVGLFLFVPLGDMKERRRMITILLAAVAVSLVGIAAAPSLLWMDIASFLVGITTVTPQMMVPLAAQLAAPAERGKVIGSVMGGLLIGILLARTVAGAVGGSLGWRTMFWIAAGLMLVLAIILRVYLPQSFPESKLTYRGLLTSIGHLIAEQRTLREASIIAAMMFGGFSAFWSTLAFFIAGDPYHYGSEVAGLFGLVGVAGVMAAPLAGRLSDRFQAKFIVGVSISTALLSYLFFWLFGLQLWGLVIGVILLDLGVQGGQIANQARVYSLVPEARSRLNTVYMVSSFLFGSIGSSLGSYAWSVWGWNGVCAVGGSMILIGFTVWGLHRIKN